MAFEDLKARLAMLMDEIAQNPQDAHQLQEQLREQIAEMRSMGMAVPEELIGLEDYLEDGLEVPGPQRRPPSRPEPER